MILILNEDCISALSLSIDDFEDALAVTCAQKTNVAYIITRDDKLLSYDLLIKVITPTELLNLLS